MDAEAQRRGQHDPSWLETEVSIHAEAASVVIELSGALDQPMADAVTLAATTAIAEGREVLLDVGGLRDAESNAIRAVVGLLSLDDAASVRMRGTWPPDGP